MTGRWYRGVVLGVLAALLLPALPVAAPAPGPDRAPATDSLRGQLRSPRRTWATRGFARPSS
jgi:hypothetical protein